LSPERGRSFIAAVINAIRSATTNTTTTTNAASKQAARKHAANKTGGDESDSTEMLDSETEPCLMMDNVLEDVPVPDSHSQNLVSSSAQLMLSQTEEPANMVKSQDDDLNNLSLAITNRQNIELQTSMMVTRNVMRQPSCEHSLSEEISGHESIAEMPSLAVDYCSAQTLVDQVIEVDNLVTKLLKVLRLVQIDNDNCIQELINDR
jgi:hypothetical protein